MKTGCWLRVVVGYYPEEDFDVTLGEVSPWWEEDIAELCDPHGSWSLLFTDYVFSDTHTVNGTANQRLWRIYRKN